MKIRTRIYIYQTLTVLFALLTLISLGNVMSESLLSTVTRAGLFGMLTKECFLRECECEYLLKAKKSDRSLRIYTSEKKAA